MDVVNSPLDVHFFIFSKSPPPHPPFMRTSLLKCLSLEPIYLPEKSAAPVAAKLALLFNATPQTAPL